MTYIIFKIDIKKTKNKLQLINKIKNAVPNNVEITNIQIEEICEECKGTRTEESLIGFTTKCKHCKGEGTIITELD